MTQTIGSTYQAFVIKVGAAILVASYYKAFFFSFFLSLFFSVGGLLNLPIGRTFKVSFVIFSKFLLSLGYCNYFLWIFHKLSLFFVLFTSLF